jgi:hypothetical protein
MRIISRLLGLAFAAIAVTSIVGAFVARSMKERIIRRDDPKADEVRLVAIMEPIRFQSRAKSFRGGTVDCWYGGGLIDLRGATLDPAGATLRVRAIFGGAHVAVPESWDVTTRVVGIGGVGGRPPGPRPADAPRLTIQGIVLFGGFGVSSEVSEAEERGLAEAIAHQERRRAGAQPEPEPLAQPMA